MTGASIPVPGSLLHDQILVGVQQVPSIGSQEIPFGIRQQFWSHGLRKIIVPFLWWDAPPGSPYS